VKRFVLALAVLGILIPSIIYAQTLQLPVPKGGKKTKGSTQYTMGSIAASDSNFVPAPVIPTWDWDFTYFSVAADDSFVIYLYAADSTKVIWRPIPKLFATPITRRFRGVPVSGLGVVRADSANAAYEVIWYRYRNTGGGQ